MVYRRKTNKQGGQVAVVMALVLTALLLFTALAIDGANAYQQRRMCQNAADSSALAGVALLRSNVTNPSAVITNQGVYDLVKSYAQQNVPVLDDLTAQYVNVNREPIGEILSFGTASAPPAAATGVQVRVHTRYRLFLGGLIGQSQNRANALATSSSGSLGALSGGAFPVGIPESLLRGVAPGDLLRIFDDNRVENLAGQQLGERGWLNFNFVYNALDAIDPDSRAVTSSQSNDDLRRWVTSGYENGIFAGPPGTLQGDLIDGDPGVRSSTIGESNARVGDTVFLPVYDTIYSGTYLRENASPRPNVDFVASGNYYHIIGFAAFRITDTQRGGQEKYLEGAFVNYALSGQLGGQFSAGTTGGIVGLSLVSDSPVASVVQQFVPGNR